MSEKLEIVYLKKCAVYGINVHCGVEATKEHRDESGPYAKTITEKIDQGYIRVDGVGNAVIDVTEKNMELLKRLIINKHFQIKWEVETDKLYKFNKKTLEEVRIEIEKEKLQKEERQLREKIGKRRAKTNNRDYSKELDAKRKAMEVLGGASVDTDVNLETKLNELSVMNEQIKVQDDIKAKEDGVDRRTVDGMTHKNKTTRASAKATAAARSAKAKAAWQTRKANEIKAKLDAEDADIESQKKEDELTEV